MTMTFLSRIVQFWPLSVTNHFLSNNISDILNFENGYSNVKLRVKVHRESGIFPYFLFLFLSSPFFLILQLLVELRISASFMILQHRSLSLSLVPSSTMFPPLEFPGYWIQVGPFCLLPSGWEKVSFLQDALPSTLYICVSHFSLAISIISNVLGYLYKL